MVVDNITRQDYLDGTYSAEYTYNITFDYLIENYNSVYMTSDSVLTYIMYNTYSNDSYVKSPSYPTCYPITPQPNGTSSCNFRTSEPIKSFYIQVVGH